MGLGLLGAAWLLSACDPLPVLELTVTTSTDGNDADPGDGTCEMTDGAGDCSLRAAIDEANATVGHDVTVLVPADTYDISGGTSEDTNTDGDLDVDIATALTVVGQGAGAVIDSGGDDGGIDVLAGNVTVRNLAIRGSAGRALLTRTGATLTVDQSAIHDNPGGGIITAPDSTTVVTNSTISANEPGIFNNGNVLLAFTTVTDNEVGGLLGPGTATAAATIIADQQGLIDCAAPVTSLGYNIDSDDTCGLIEPNDQSDVPTAALAPLSTDPVPFHLPTGSSPAFESIPTWAPFCADDLVDQQGVARPQGSACEAGAVEIDDPPPDFVVDTPSDAVDAAPGDGLCLAVGGGCTLRAAVGESNDLPGMQVVGLAVDPVLTITGPGWDGDNDIGDLDISDDLTLLGDGHAVSDGAVDGGGPNVTGADVTIEAATFEGRFSASGPVTLIDVDAAGIDATDDLRLDGSTMAGRVSVVAANASVEIHESTITGGDAGDGDGGGLHVDGSHVFVTDSEISGSTAGGMGGGVYLEDGGGNIERTTISGNSAGAGGGGLAAVRVDLVVIDSTLSGNQAATYGGGAHISGGYITEFIRSTISGNVAGAGGDTGAGGGIAAFSGELTVVTATISGNTVEDVTDVSAAHGGGGIYASDLDYAAISGSTIVFNEATQSGVPTPVHQISGPLSLRGTIVADDVPGGVACSGITSLGHNLATDATCGATGTDLANTDAQLGPLADNGGPTRTHLPPLGSPAIDSVPVGTSGLCTAPATTDQRGVARPQGAACDRGAVEARLPLELLVTTFDDAGDVDPGDGVCEMIGGPADCSLRAAVDEINAGGLGGTIVLQPGTYPLIPSLSDEDDNASGDLDLEAGPGVTIDTDGSVIDADGGLGAIEVLSGELTLQRVALTGATDVALLGRADANVVIDQGSIHGNDGAGLITESGGTATVERSTISSSSPGIFNNGEVSVTFSTITDNDAGGLLGPGDATLAASIVADQAVGPDCAAPVTSQNHNIDSDGTCGLLQSDDQSNASSAGLDPLSPDMVPFHLPTTGSVAIDAIPVGARCPGDASLLDQRGLVRPLGGACDVGAIETYPGPQSFIVDSSFDSPDANPGDSTCADSLGRCTLRAAVDEANAGESDDTISIADGIDPVLSLDGADDGNVSGDIDILHPVSIDGAGATIDGGDLDRVLHTTADLALHDLRLTNGITGGDGGLVLATGDALDLSEVVLDGGQAGGSGGGLHHSDGAATLTDVHVHDNQAAAFGGGVSSADGSLSVARSTIADNSATDGGGISLARSTGSIVDVTASGNTASRGGGLTYQTTDAFGPGAVAITASTFVDNTAPDGAAIDRILPGVTATAISVQGSILSGTGTDCDRAVVSAGHNLDTDGSCDLTGTNDQTTTEALVEPLADNGGFAPTHLPYADSPAVDAIAPGVAALCDAGRTDQRGVARPAGAGCDIGAVEGVSSTAAAPLALTVDAAADALDATPGDGVCATSTDTCTMRAAISESNAWPGADTITIDPGIDPVLTLPGTDDDLNVAGDLDITDSVQIDGAGAAIDAAGIDRVIDVHDGIVELRQLTVTGGDTTEIGGGIRAGAGQLTVLASTITGNAADGGGGGIEYDYGVANGVAKTVLTVRNTTVSGNEGAGGIRSSGPTLLEFVSLIGNGDTYSGALSLGGLYDRVGATIIDGTCGGSFESLGFNQAEGLCNSLTQPTDAQLTIAHLLPLGDNGGPTPTHLPYDNSPGVGAIPAGTPGLCDGSIPVDQRGIARPSGGACDVGAVEGSSGTDLPALDLVVDTAADGTDSSPGDGLCDVGDGSCSLRAAISESNAWPTRDTISIADGVDPVLSIPGANEDGNVTGDLDISSDLTLVGGGATVDAAGLDRVIDAGQHQIELIDLTITGGSSGTGGGVLFRGGVGHLQLSGATVSGNSAAYGGGIAMSSGSAFGGHVTSGLLTVTGSTISGNQATGSGGVLDGGRGGGLYLAGGQSTIVSSTVSGNSGPAGAGVHTGFPLAVNLTGRVDLIASTVADNTGTTALARESITPGIIPGTYVGTELRLHGTVVQHTGNDCERAAVSLGRNLASDTTCALAGAGDLQNANALLGPLASNGGSTLTHLPGVGSPARDVIPVGTAGLCDGALPTDQRGVARPQGAACDIGAVEQ